jgi:predicted outer membrane repeat protein
MGNLTINHITFQSNYASQGGAIYNEGGANSLTVLGSTFINNTATIIGGGINNAGGEARITNSTFSGNSAVNGAAVQNASGWTVWLENCTVAQNNGGAGGSVNNGSGIIFVHNSIIANPTTGSNCPGTMTFANNGNNLDSGSSCGWVTDKGSLSNTNPRLLPLNNYGGKTRVFALQAGSPAIDAVTYDPSSYPAQDQRGVNRPVDGNFNGVAAADIGAFELGPTVILPLVIRYEQ